MNSIDDARLQRFYDDHLEPAARRLRERGISFFPLGPEPGAKTWYSAPPKGDAFSTLREAECGEVLQKMWRDQKLPELADLVEGLMDLSRELEVSEEETPDISPFVYVMY